MGVGWVFFPLSKKIRLWERKLLLPSLCPTLETGSEPARERSVGFWPPSA